MRRFSPRPRRSVSPAAEPRAKRRSIAGSAAASAERARHANRIASRRIEGSGRLARIHGSRSARLTSFDGTFAISSLASTPAASPSQLGPVAAFPARPALVVATLLRGSEIRRRVAELGRSPAARRARGALEAPRRGGELPATDWRANRPPLLGGEVMLRGPQHLVIAFDDQRRPCVGWVGDWERDRPAARARRTPGGGDVAGTRSAARPERERR